MFRPNQPTRWQTWVYGLKINRNGVISNANFSLIDYAINQKNAGRIATARATLRRAIDEATHSRLPDSKRVQAEALIHLGDLNRNLQNSDSERLYEQAQNLYRVLSEHNLGVATHRRATLHQQRGQFAHALIAYNQTLLIWQSAMREEGRRGNKHHHLRYCRQIQWLVDQIQAMQAPPPPPPPPAPLVPVPPAPRPPVVPIQVPVPPAPTPVIPIPVPPAPPPPVPVLPVPSPIPILVPTISRILLDTFEKIPILEDRAAANITGAFVAYDDQIKETARLGSVAFIGDRQYVLVNLEDGRSYFPSTSNYPHFVIQVTGISMDSAHPVSIQDQDYVLIRRPKDIPYQPSPFHIIVAVLSDTVGDRRAVLKRYDRHDWGYRLISESSKPDVPEHQPRDFTQKDSHMVRFIGQAVAVLRPVPNNP